MSSNLIESLNDGSRTVAGGRSYRTRSSLLVVQIGLAVVLLVAAGLVVQSFNALQRLDLGFTREAVMRIKVEPRSTPLPVNEWIGELLSRVRQLPEVAVAGGVYLTPMELGSIGQGTWAIAEGQPETSGTANSNPIVNYQSATPDYFRAMGIPLLRGRMFSEEDRATSPRVALISESTAAAFFPGQDPVGKRFKAASFNANDRNIEGVWRTVIGVVGNVRYKGLHEVQLDMYDPPSQTTVGTTTSLVVRLKPGQERNALAVATAIQTQARQSDPRALVSGISMLDDIVNKEIAPWRFSAWVFALFAGLAFALAMLGLFSLVSLDVANRRPRVRDSHGRRCHQPSPRRRRVPLGRLARGPRHRRRAGGGGHRHAKFAEPALRRAARRRAHLWIGGNTRGDRGGGGARTLPARRRCIRRSARACYAAS